MSTEPEHDPDIPTHPYGQKKEAKFFSANIGSINMKLMC